MLVMLPIPVGSIVSYMLLWWFWNQQSMEGQAESPRAPALGQTGPWHLEVTSRWWKATWGCHVWEWHGITHSMPCNTNDANWFNNHSYHCCNWGIIHFFHFFYIQQQPGHWWLVTFPLRNSGREAHLTDFDCLDLTTEVLSRSLLRWFMESQIMTFLEQEILCCIWSIWETSISGH